MAPLWAAFLGLTGFVLVAMLALARLSQQALEREPSPEPSAATSSAPRRVRRLDDAPGEEPASDGAPDAVDDAPGEGTVRDETAGEMRDGVLAAVGDAPGEATIAVPSLDPDTTTQSVETVADSPSTDTGTADADATGKPAVSDRSRPRKQPSLQDLSPAALLANVALTHGLFAGALVVGAWYFRIPAAAFGVAASAASTGLPAVGLGIAFGLALWVANEVGARVADAMGVGYDESLRALLGPDSLAGWALLLGAVLPIIAVGEELLFRGALIGVPAAGFGVSPWALAVASSVAFALGHGAQGVAGIVVTGVLGLVLAAGYVLTGSLLVVIVAHYVVNAMEFIVHEAVEPDWLPERARE